MNYLLKNSKNHLIDTSLLSLTDKILTGFDFSLLTEMVFIN